MRRPMIAGNWKMNTNLSQCSRIVSSLKRAIYDNHYNVDIAVFPPFLYLLDAKDILEGTQVLVGAQDVYFEEEGAFTGEISTNMLLDVGCKIFLAGHSERRHVLGESNEFVGKKLQKGISKGLIGVLCVGEKLEEREANKAEDVIKAQLIEGLKNVSEEMTENLIVAYEPVWAIGTGKTATPEIAENMHSFIRNFLSERYSKGTSDNIRILYGGSVKPNNVKGLMDKQNIDGALVGGASLDPESFIEIINYDN